MVTIQVRGSKGQEQVSSEVGAQALVGSGRCLSWRAVESREFQMTQGFRARLPGGVEMFCTDLFQRKQEEKHILMGR